MTDEPKVMADVAFQNLRIENTGLKSDVASLKTKCDALEKALLKANSIIDAENRARLIPRIKAVSTITDAELNVMTTEDLSKLDETYRYLKTPYAGVGSAVDSQPATPNLTVPGRFRFAAKAK